MACQLRQQSAGIWSGISCLMQMRNSPQRCRRRHVHMMHNIHVYFGLLSRCSCQSLHLCQLQLHGLKTCMISCQSACRRGSLDCRHCSSCWYGLRINWIQGVHTPGSMIWQIHASQIQCKLRAESFSGVLLALYRSCMCRHMRAFHLLLSVCLYSMCSVTFNALI